MYSIFNVLFFLLMLSCELVCGMDHKDVADLGAQSTSSSIVRIHTGIQGWTLNAEELQEFRERKNNLEKELADLWSLKSSIEFLEDKIHTTIQKLEPSKRCLEIHKRAKIKEFEKLHNSKKWQQAEHQYLTEKLEEYEQGQQAEHKSGHFIPDRTQRNTMLLSLGVDLKTLEDYPSVFSLGALTPLSKGVVFLSLDYLPIETLGQCLSACRSFNLFADRALYFNYKSFYAFLHLDFDKIAKHLSNKELVNLSQISKALHRKTQEHITSRKREYEEKRASVIRMNRIEFYGLINSLFLPFKVELSQNIIPSPNLENLLDTTDFYYNSIKSQYEMQRLWRKTITDLLTILPIRHMDS